MSDLNAGTKKINSPSTVLFASLIGILAYKERYSIQKLAGVLCITLGIVTFTIQI